MRNRIWIAFAEFGSIADTGTVSGSTYTSAKANGATLVDLGNGQFRYTAGDGTKVDYSALITEFGNPDAYVVDGGQCQSADPGYGCRRRG